MWSALATVFGAVLTVAAGVLRASHRSRSGRRLRYHAELMDALGNAPEAQAEIRAIVLAQARELRAREERRLSRVLNKINLGLAITLTALSAGGIYLMIRLALAPSPLQWLVIIGTVLLGLVGLVLSLAAFSMVYNPPPGSSGSGAET